MEEIVKSLQENLNGDSLFVISREGNTIQIDFDLVNQNFWFLMTKHSVKYLHTIYIQVDEAAKSAKIWNEWREVRWDAGVPSFGAKISMSLNKGTTYNFVKEVGYKTTLDGIEKAYDANINTFNLLSQVKLIVSNSGYRLRMDAYTKIGLMVGIGSLVATALAFIVMGLVNLLK